MNFESRARVQSRARRQILELKFPCNITMTVLDSHRDYRVSEQDCNMSALESTGTGAEILNTGCNQQMADQKSANGGPNCNDYSKANTAEKILDQEYYNDLPNGHMQRSQ